MSATNVARTGTDRETFVSTTLCPRLPPPLGNFFLRKHRPLKMLSRSLSGDFGRVYKAPKITQRTKNCATHLQNTGNLRID